MTSEEKVKKCLDLCRLDASSKQFTIGPFFSNGVTLLKQQVRALNLIYALSQSNPPLLSQDQCVAVIGGGIAGVTAAAAAAYLGSEVYLFEQRPVLCHLQHGCDTRHVHPRIYDWPRHGSDNPYAELPLLNWKAGTAAEVTEQIVAKFDEVKREAPRRLHLHLGATTRSAANCRVRWDNSSGKPRGGEKKFDLVVFATGFGIELRVGEGSTQSYWRNDDLNQPTPGITSEKPQLCFISGTGDGGLIDLLRCRIKSFNQAWILNELVQMEDLDLLIALRDIASAWNSLRPTTRSKRNRWLFERYNLLRKREHLNGLRRRVRCRLRPDTTAILNGPAATFAEALRLDSASLFNTLITFLLYDLKAFSYVNGDCLSVTNSGEVTIEQNPLKQMKKPHRVTYKIDRLIIRHGTDIKKTLQMLGVKNRDIESLEKRQKAQNHFDSAEHLWPAGWWSDTRRARLNQGTLVRNRIEFVPPATVAVATIFVSTLSAILVEWFDQKRLDSFRNRKTHAVEIGAGQPRKEFRATLHRLLKIRGEDLFQQIAFYRGYGSRLEGRPARVFDVKSGLVGLSCRLGRAVVLNRQSPEDNRWDELWRELHVGKEIETPSKSINSMLACPLFSAHAPEDDHTMRYVLMVLFMDSAEPGFFKNDAEMHRMLISSCADFVRNLNDLSSRVLEKGPVLRFASSDFHGYPVPKSRSLQDSELIVKYGDYISEIGGEENDLMFRDEASFKEYKSLDIDI